MAKTHTLNQDQKLDLILETVLDNSKRIQALEKRMFSLEKRMSSLEKRMSSLEKQFVSLEKRVVSLENRMTSLEKISVSQDKRLKKLESKFDMLFQEVGGCRDDIQELKFTVQSISLDNSKELYSFSKRMDRTQALIRSLHKKELQAAQ